jgi:hypothetical protein
MKDPKKQLTHPTHPHKQQKKKLNSSSKDVNGVSQGSKRSEIEDIFKSAKK